MSEYIEKNHLYKVIPIYNNREKIVASVNMLVGDWSAYVGKGTWKKVVKWGDKIRQDIAEDYFPEIAKKYRWRG